MWLVNIKCMLVQVANILYRHDMDQIYRMSLSMKVQILMRSQYKDKLQTKTPAAWIKTRFLLLFENTMNLLTKEFEQQNDGKFWEKGGGLTESAHFNPSLRTFLGSL